MLAASSFHCFLFRAIASTRPRPALTPPPVCFYHNLPLQSGMMLMPATVPVPFGVQYKYRKYLPRD